MQKKSQGSRMINQKIQISSNFEILKLLCDMSTARTFGGTPLSGLLAALFCYDTSTASFEDHSTEQPLRGHY